MEASYIVQKSRFYRPSERYSTGEGFSGITENRAQAALWYAVFARSAAEDRDGNLYTVELRELSGNEKIIERLGPPMSQTNASMHAAYRRRATSARRSES